ncbi:MAG TPA: SpoIID/LytB domain-containing protein [Gaiellaceae bacterium]|nr:SpoIID/LytB domain-containing protein [Gaiellaceae bacterium]
MRRVLVAAIALVVALSCAAAAQPAATFVLKGRGWGHGLGLAQYGAHGFARDGGRDYAWILDHYYRGSTLGTSGVGRVRVLLASGAGSLSIGSASAFTVRDANGRTFNLSAGTHVLRTNLRIRTASGALRRLASPVRFSPGSALLRLSGNRYRGLVRVRTQGGRLSAVNDIALEPYVKGVVAWEMPASWHPEALKAQAVVARTYGLVSRKSGSWFDLFADTRSQVYGGVRAEDPRTNAAVDATAGEVVRSGGALAWTFYHSTSGGKTASREDEWGPPGVSYLVGVPDPHDDISPHHRWGPLDPEDDCSDNGRDCVWSATALKRALGSRAPSAIRDFTVVARNGSSRVERTRLRGPSGDTSITGADLRSLLGLRSTWFSIGVLRLNGGGSIEEDQEQTLRALERNLSNVTLQRRNGAGEWVDLRQIEGRVNVSVRPAATTLYRLRSPAATTAPVRVVVEAAPRFTSNVSTEALNGVATPGDRVQVQRRVSVGSWATTAVAVAREDGSWSAALDVVSGEYRAYVDSDGDVETSPTLTIVVS